MTHPTPTDDDLVKRLRAPAYWMSGSSEGHEGDNDAPVEAADRIEAQAAEIERLTAERDALQAKLQERALQELADLGQYTDWQIQAAEREAAAFRAGAEAMREAVIKEVQRVFGQPNAEWLRALPIPDHQSSTQTGTKPT